MIAPSSDCETTLVVSKSITASQAVTSETLETAARHMMGCGICRTAISAQERGQLIYAAVLDRD